jgi:hypothetical protein
MSPRCSASATSCAAAARICTAAWRCCPARPRARRQGGVQRARQLARQYRGYLRGKASEPVADPIIRAGSARCWRWPIPTASPSSAAPVAPNTAWPMAALRCSPKPTA